MSWYQAVIATTALLASTPVLAASGTVNFTFTSFQGPTQLVRLPYPGLPVIVRRTGLVNNEVVPLDGGSAPYSSASSLGWYTGATTFTTPLSQVGFRYAEVDEGSVADNFLSFEPADFSNVSLGQSFKLGTLTFKNGGWFGAGKTPADNLPTYFGFTITTSSLDGAAFNQTIAGTIKVTVNAPADNNTDTLAGQEAEADWVTIVSSALLQTGDSLRVYDDYAKPSGSSNIGSIDLIAYFNSLDLVGFDNPQGGGFFTAGDQALPNDPFLPVVIPPVGGVPEPASWALMVAGFGLTGAAMRQPRRRKHAGL
jgi:hypothetical protein